MNERYFTLEQTKYIYSDSSFFGFVNQYFSSFTPVKAETGLTYFQNWDKELEKVCRELMIRVSLVNISKFRSIAVRIERKLSYSYKNTNVEVKGEIKGRLSLNEYFKRKGMQQTPKIFPCMVKQKTYNTPENVFFVFVINQVIHQIKNYQSYIKMLGEADSSESRLLDDNIMYFTTLTKKAYYSESVTTVRNIERLNNCELPRELKQCVELRLRKRQMPNTESYYALWDWYINFGKHGLSYAGEVTAETLIYDELFSDKLYELWLLHRIKQILIEEYRLTLIEENNLRERSNKCVFKVKTNTGKEMCLYFQKGKDLLWDDTIKSKWCYDGEQPQPLRGIPDIVVEYLDAGTKKVVLIDAKNRIRNRGENAEEIYKVLGYYENFSLYIQNKYGADNKFYSALAFRNDINPFNERLITDKEDQIMVLSISPESAEQVNKDQVKLLCRFILDACGREGCTAEIIGQYKSSLEQILQNSTADLDEESLLSQISNNNHAAFESAFALPEMEKEIERTRIALKTNHYPHIWDKLNESAQKMLAMAECMFNLLGNSDSADYAPVCLEYCRALEVTLNRLIYDQFKSENNIPLLANANRNYQSLTQTRDLTLGESVYVLSKAIAPTPNQCQVSELKLFVNTHIKRHLEIWNNIDLLRNINEMYRREAAHTRVMSYDELKKCRELLLGIGHISPFYLLLDER